MSERVAVDNPDLALRPMVPADEAFVFATWLNATKRSTDESRRVKSEVFFRRRHALYERIISRGQVLVAHLSGDPDTILGYVVAEPHRSPPILHFAFVKLPWRRLGIATRLVEALVPEPNRARFTCLTRWTLGVPTPKGVDRSDRSAVREGRSSAVRQAERDGGAGGDAEDLIRKWPGLVYDPDARWVLED